MIIDTHCHLDDTRFLEDLDEVIASAKKSGVLGFLIPGADPDTLPRAVKISEQYKEVFFGVGFHPYDANKFDMDILKEYSKHPKCIAIGECGLDYYRLPENEDDIKKEKKLQKEVFIEHIEFAKKVKKPLIVHIREASSDSYDLLIKYHGGDVGGVLHCYNADEILLKLADKNFYYGIGGVITFKNGKRLPEVLKKIPKDKLLIETDAPYLTPHPYRGKRNEPKYCNDISQKIGEILEMGKESIDSLTTNNGYAIFREFSTLLK